MLSTRHLLCSSTTTASALQKKTSPAATVKVENTSFPSTVNVEKLLLFTFVVIEKNLLRLTVTWHFIQERLAPVDAKKRKHQDEPSTSSNKRRYKKQEEAHPVLSTTEQCGIDSSVAAFSSPSWLPSTDPLNKMPFIQKKVRWHEKKILRVFVAVPLRVDHQPYFDALHPVEAEIVSTLRFTPADYLRCKRTLVTAARRLQKSQVPFTISTAQRLCRIDDRKTSILWKVFRQLGLFH
ncbi:MAG: hypothetical protein EXX96DRAFT_638822 [Benjaminiella poitrasii]|nr:MAG: hypothetical protein EXX96DRAFT_638822 [Benjaminiella poitrasii]